MDLNTVTSYRIARSRDDLRLGPGETLLAGGTWLFSEPQLGTSGLVDLTGLDWPAVEVGQDRLRVAATCTIAELAALSQTELAEWPALPLFAQCASALLASFKVQQIATVGGNIARSFAAAGMVSLCAGLDAVAEVWRPDGTDYRVLVADLITGNGSNTLAAGEVLRAVEFGVPALSARTGYRKIALTTYGRSAAVLTGRVDPDGGATFGITAATTRPTLLRYPELPDPGRLRADANDVAGYYTDPLGTADWRRAVSGVLLAEIAEELR